MDELLSLGLDVVHGTSAVTERVPRAPQARRRAQMRAGALTVGDGLDKNIVRRFFRRSLPRLRFCYEKALAANPKLAGTTVLNLKIKPDGSVTSVKASGLGNKTVETCMIGATRAIQFPKPKNGATVAVNIPFTLSSQTATRSNFGSGSMGMRAPSGWVLTRLHARYDRTSLGEDLVFKEASPIAGGQGGASDKLETSATESGNNSFQGRYIIRHEWTGPIECENPRRGMWGGPPAGIARDTSTKAATDLAFAPRGGVSLASMVSEPVASLGVAPSANAAPPAPRSANAIPEGEAPAKGATSSEPLGAAPATPADSEKETSKGCSSSGHSSQSTALLLFLVLLAIRRRTRAPVGAPR
jgi:hypothetical protein